MNDKATYTDLNQLLKQGMERQKQADFAGAKVLFDQALALSPGQPMTLSLLAAAAYQLGDNESAQEFLAQAVIAYQRLEVQSPYNPQIKAGRANLLLSLGRSEEAEGLCRSLALPIVPLQGTEAVFQDQRNRGLALGRKSIFINTLPKSASESIWNRLSKGLGLGQAHMSLGFFPECCLIGHRMSEFLRGGLSSKEHIPATRHNLRVLADKGVSQMVFHLRDPRQAALSWAHFLKDDLALRPMATIWRKIVPPSSILFGSLPDLVDWTIDNYLPLTLGYIADWVAVSEDKNSKLSILFVDFETFKRSPKDYYEAILKFYDLPADSFELDEADRADDGHFRKGALDEWRQVFTPEQQARAWAAFPPGLAQRFGWTP